MPPPSPQEFASAAAQSDGYEIAAGQDAVAQSRNPRVQEFARQMVSAHTGTAHAMGEAAKASGLEAPRPMVGADQARMLMALQSLRGEDFDRTYVRQQVLAHTQALTVMRGYAASGSDANLRRAAQTAVPVIEDHLKMARQLADLVGDH